MCKGKRIGLVLLLVLTMVAPLFGAGQAEPGVVTIRYANFSAGEHNAETLRKMVDLFMAKNPNIKVELESMGYGDNYWTSLITRIAGGDAPDAFELNMEQFLAFTLRGSNRPLDELFTKTGMSKNVFGEGLLDAVSFNGKVMAIPQSFSTVVLIYNKAFVRQRTPYPTADGHGTHSKLQRKSLLWARTFGEPTIRFSSGNSIRLSSRMAEDS